MASKDLCFKVQDHGTALDEKKIRVRCSHCGKVVSGFSRLKCHLGGVRGDVTPCLQVPDIVKEVFHNELIQKKKEYLSKEVQELSCPNLPLRRNLLSLIDSSEPHGSGHTQTSGLGCEKRLKIAVPSEVCETVSFSFPEMPIGSESAASAQSSSLKEFQKRVGKFFYETGIDISDATCPSFHRMINANFGSEETAYSIPSCEDLRGWILQETVEEMRQYVREIQSSWASTGCSILLDGWEDLTGRKLLNILVACPKGTVYIQSADISAFDQEGNCMLALLDDVLKEVGVSNVVQIITYSTSDSMERVRKLVEGKYKMVFWAVSASYCLERMLEKIGRMDVVEETINKAKTITQFVHSRASVLKLLRDQTSVHDLVRPSKFKSTVPFLTLENMVTEQENLRNMFLSTVWKTSRWASTVEGKRVAGLVADRSFWIGAAMVLKGTIPLVRVIDMITKNNEPQMGYLYETMDQAKETIKEEFKNKESAYMPFWKIIDEIWDGYLHSHLHPTGYFLNPKLFYVNGFHTDSEVLSGILYSIVRLVEDQGFKDVITLQIEEYRKARGSFAQGYAHLDSSPESWWSSYGTEYPQLQRFAIRILSQTCDGAARYNLKRSLAEKLLTAGRNLIEQQRLTALAFVHYNLQLQNFNLGIANDFSSDEIDPMDDWVVDETQPILS